MNENETLTYWSGVEVHFFPAEMTPTIPPMTGVQVDVVNRRGRMGLEWIMTPTPTSKWLVGSPCHWHVCRGVPSLMLLSHLCVVCCIVLYCMCLRVYGSRWYRICVKEEMNGKKEWMDGWMGDENENESEWQNDHENKRYRRYTLDSAHTRWITNDDQQWSTHTNQQDNNVDYRDPAW